MKKNILSILLNFILIAPAFSQAGKWDFSDGSGSSGAGGFGTWFIGFIIVLALIFGSNEVRKTIFITFLWIAGLIGYMFFLFELGKYLQQAISPAKDGIGFIVLITFAVGWFAPLTWWYKKGK